MRTCTSVVFLYALGLSCLFTNTQAMVTPYPPENLAHVYVTFVKINYFRNKTVKLSKTILKNESLT